MAIGAYTVAILTMPLEKDNELLYETYGTIFTKS